MKKYSPEDCFLVYVNLGEERTFQKVSEITGKSEGTLRNYSSKLKWNDRLKALKEQDKSVIQALINDNSNGVKLLESDIYRGVSEKLLEIIRDSMPLLKPTDNARELKTLVDTYRLLNNQPTDIQRQETATIQTETLTDEELTSLGSLAVTKLFGEHEA